mgnify:CR=1 FL=1|jgi:hypothetical protein
MNKYIISKRNTLVKIDTDKLTEIVRKKYVIVVNQLVKASDNY